MPAAGENFEKGLSKSAPQAKILQNKGTFMKKFQTPPRWGGTEKAPPPAGGGPN